MWHFHFLSLLFQWAFNWLEARHMEESGNKGLGSAMQSDTSLHDSALKWWDGCEANTLPFNEGLSLAPSRMSPFLPCLPLFFFFLPPFPRFFLTEWMKVAEVRDTHTPVCGRLSEVHAGQRSALLITVGGGRRWRR